MRDEVEGMAQWKNRDKHAHSTEKRKPFIIAAFQRVF